jgi:hypothetical protein
MRVPTEYAGTRPDPILVGSLRSFKNRTLCGPGPQAVPAGLGRVAAPMRGASADRGSPPPQMPRRAQEWVDRLDVCGVERPSRDRRAAHRRARRPEHQEQQRRVRPFPSARPAASSVADFADCACAVRQVHSAALGGVLGPHQIRRAAARRRRRPDHHGQPRVTLCRPERRQWGRTPNRPESAQDNASPIRTISQPARRVRRGGGGGAAAGIVRALLLRPARRASNASLRTQHCTDRALRPTPTHPRHDVRVGLRCIRRW